MFGLFKRAVLLALPVEIGQPGVTLLTQPCPVERLADNLYGYVGGNPASRIDPTGEYYQLVGFGIGFLGNAAYQPYQNGGNLSCVNWWEAASWGLVGATGGIFARAGIVGIQALATRQLAAEGLGGFLELLSLV